MNLSGCTKRPRGRLSNREGGRAGDQSPGSLCMAKKNIKRIVGGFVLMILAVISAGAAFYFLETRPQIWGENLSASQRKSLPAPAGHLRKGGAVASSVARGEPYEEAAGTDGTSLSSLHDKRGPEGMMSASGGQTGGPLASRQTGQEGFLWIDRVSSLHVMTLGRIHGVESGRRVAIFDGTDRIGEVTVDQALEGTSYVHPSPGQAMDLSRSDYYRAVVE